jgi:CubicO group peptidase (beta-lactamase class C family)
VAIDGRPVDTVELPLLDEKRAAAFLEEQLRFDRYVFLGRNLPRAEWKRPRRVANEIGSSQLRIRYFDAAMKPVKAADRPGRYGAVVEATAADGYVVKRYQTLYCAAPDDGNWRLPMDAVPPTNMCYGIDQAVWRAHRAAWHELCGLLTLGQVVRDRRAAVFLSGMNEIAGVGRGPGVEDDPWNRERQWWVTLKRRLVGASTGPPAKPGQASPAARELVEGDPAAAGYGEKERRAIRDVCREWAAAAGEPLATLVAHRGTIVFHEAFGTTARRMPMTPETPTHMASVTKLLTGVLMMIFVDRDLLALDDPVKTVLPDFDRRVPRDITFRHLFTHTSGLGGKGPWGLDWNPALENMAGFYLPYAQVGARVRYSGLGFAIAGKAMEMAGGLAVPALFREQLLDPIGARRTTVEGTSSDCRSVCLDMARVGQLLLNGGAYGSTRFFSRETFERMLPVKLSDLGPGLEGETGIGVMWLGGNGLSDRTIGHEAASGAIFRVDLQKRLVIVSCRNEKGPRYEEFAARLIRACAAPVGLPKQAPGG